MRDVCVVSMLLLALLVGSYKIGVIRERRAYVGGFITQVEAAYWQGFDDGQRLEKFKKQGGKP